MAKSTRFLLWQICSFLFFSSPFFASFHYRDNWQEQHTFQEKFYKFCKEGDLKSLKGVIDQVDINKKNTHKNTGVTLACSNGHLLIVEVLLRHLNINLKAHVTAHGSPLHAAILGNHLHIIKGVIKIIPKQIHLWNTKDIQGRNPLALASFFEKKEILSFLLKPKFGLSSWENLDEAYDIAAKFHLIHMTKEDLEIEGQAEMRQLIVAEYQNRGTLIIDSMYRKATGVAIPSIFVSLLLRFLVPAKSPKKSCATDNKL